MAKHLLKDRKDQEVNIGDKVNFIWRGLTLVCTVNADKNNIMFETEEIEDEKAQLLQQAFAELTDLDIDVSSVIELIKE